MNTLDFCSLQQYTTYHWEIADRGGFKIIPAPLQFLLIVHSKIFRYTGASVYWSICLLLVIQLKKQCGYAPVERQWEVGLFSLYLFWAYIFKEEGVVTF